jgi:hypothetical protein
MLISSIAGAGAVIALWVTFLWAFCFWRPGHALPHLLLDNFLFSQPPPTHHSWIVWCSFTIMAAWLVVAATTSY